MPRLLVIVIVGGWAIFGSSCAGTVGSGGSSNERSPAAEQGHPQAVPGALKATPGVSPDGTFTYEVELSVPPGTAAMAPSLSLHYASRTDGSLLGSGWSLGGLSMVHRCAATVAQDGIRGHVSLTGSDRLCLDGKRLIAVSGDYGADGTEYRLETDDTLRVVSYGSEGGSPLWLRSWTRSGQVFDYATTDDSRIEVPGSAAVMTWAVSRITDAAGNHVAFSYTEDPDSGTFEPLRIDYTGNEAQGLAPYASVRFVTTPRPADDTSASYIAGVKITPPRLLTEIQTYVGETRVRSYRLGYGQSAATRRSRLESITGCAGPPGADERCTPPTRISWSDLAPEERTFVQSSQVWSATDHSYISYVLSLGGKDGDFDGDGRADVAFPTLGDQSAWTVCLALPQGGHSCSRWAVQLPNKSSETMSGDFNGDGLTDLANHFNDTWTVCLSTGTGFSCSPWPGKQLYAAGANNTIVGDFNGDGLTDLVSNRGGNWQRCLAQPEHAWACSAVPSPGRETFESVAGDFDGDGRTDVAAYAGNGRWNVCLSDDTTWHCTQWTGHGGGVSNNLVADFNGDGKTDMAGHAGNGSWHVCLSTGKGFDCGFQQGPNKGAQDTLAADVNGDGRADMLARISGTDWAVCLSRGETFGCETWQAHAKVSGARDQIVDFSGDGKADMLHAIGNSTVLSLRAAGPAVDLVTGVVDGLAAETRVEYAPLSDASVYEKGTGAQYPDVDLGIPIQVVRSISTATGVAGGLRTTTFRYGGARARVDGRGVQGFAWREGTDLESGETTISHYRLDHPFTGMTLSSETRYHGVLHRRVVNTLAALPLGSGRAFPHVAASREETYEPSAADDPLVSVVETSSEYDAYGNALRIVATGTAGGISRTKNTQNEYANVVSPTQWQLGRLLRTTVTASESTGATPARVRTSSFAYDAAGLLASETVEPGMPLELQTSYERDGFGNIVRKTVSGPEVAPRVHATAYDPSGRFAVSETNALGHVETRVTDERLGVVTESTDAGGRTTRTSYDVAGRKLQELRPDGTSTRWTTLGCDAQLVVKPSCAYLVREETPGKPWSLVTHDRLRREILRAQQGSAGRVVVTKDVTFDAAGRTVRSARPYFVGDQRFDTTMTYDALDRLLTETGPDGAVSSSSYAGLTTTVVDAAGNQTVRVADLDGHPVLITDALGGQTRYVHDALGALVQITDAAGRVTRFEWDARGRRTAIIDPDMGTTTFDHDAFGQLVRQTDALGQTTTQTHDAAGRLVSRVEPSMTSTWIYDTAPNGIGQLASTSTSTGVEQQLAYDEAGRLTSDTRIVAGEALVISTVRDEHGRVAGTTYPSGLHVAYGYDEAGYPSQATTGDGVMLWTASDRDAEGHVTLATYGNGLVDIAAHDPRTGLPTALTTASASGTPLVSQIFEYDARRNLVRRNDVTAGVSEVFGYDPLSRLTSAAINGQPTTTMAYDAVGNLVSKSDAGTYSYAGGRLTSVQGAVNRSLSYDASGKVLSDGARTLVFTSFDMPARIASATASVDYLYDAHHQRVRAIFGRASGATATVLYVNPRVDQGPSYERESSTAGVLHKHYVHVAGKTVALITRTAQGADQVRYLHKDHLGSLVAVTDAAANLVARYAYDAWGKRRDVASPAAPPPPPPADPGDGGSWRPPIGTVPPAASAAASEPEGPIRPAISRGFTLHEHLDDLGLVHMNGRVYDPVLGRFLSADPYIESYDNPLALNRYAYVFNNPLNHVDPSGYFSLKKFFKKIAKSPILRTVIGVVCAWLPINWAVAAFVSGVVTSGGDFRSGVLSVLSAGMFNAVGAGIRGAPGSLAKVVAHGVVGGITSAAGGGSFRSGFLAAAFGQAVAPFTMGHGKPVDLFLSAVAGGAGSVLGGGKFANGAITAAFGRLFNDYRHPVKFAIGLFEDPVTGNPHMLREFADRIGAMTYGDLFAGNSKDMATLQKNIESAMRGASQIDFNMKGFNSAKFSDQLISSRFKPQFKLGNITNWELWTAMTKYPQKLVVHTASALGNVAVTLATMTAEADYARGGMFNPLLMSRPRTCNPSDPWCS